MKIRFDPHRGKFVLRLHCSVAFEQVSQEGVLGDDLAEGLGEAYLSPADLAHLVAAKPRAVSTWYHPDGRAFTIGFRGGEWQLVWHGKGQDSSRQFKVSASGYREFVSARRAEGFRVMPLVESPPPVPQGRY